MNQQNTCKEEETPKVIPHKEASTAKEENRRDQPQDFRDQLIREGVPLDPLKKQIKEVADDFAGQNRIKLAFSQSKIGSTVSNFRERAMESLPIVDKTGILYKLLVENKNNSAFVIGPRRFGKSMAAQTVKAIFRNGWEWWTSHCTELSIVKDYNYKFPIHPVLYLDFSALTTPKSLVKDIFDSLRDLIEDNDLKESFAADIKIFEDDKSIDNMLSIFKRAIRTIAKKHTRGVVIIIDEYDYPLVSAAEELLFRSGSNPNPKDIHLDEETQETRNCMKKIFEAIKILRQDTDLGPTFEGSGTIVRFFYLTGIVPLNQTSLFSGPNDVYDVRANPDYAEILGYREEDIKKVFKEVLDSIAKKELQLHSPLSELTNIRIEGMKKEIMDDIRKTYNGFRFNFEREETLYNPFCINYLLDNWNFNAVDKYPGYFSKSGSSKLIWIAVKHMPIMEKIKFYQDLMGNKNIEAVYTCRKEELLDKQSLQSLFTDPAKLGFFSGFFTIEKKGSTGSTWNLKIVNNEMRKHLCQEIDSKLKLSASFEKMIVSLEKDDIPTFFELYNDKLKNMSAFSNPSEQQYEDNEEFEGYGHTLFILLLDRFQHFIETTAKQKGINSLKFISNRSVDSSNKRFDCWISFEKHNNVNIYGFEIEFKCKKNLDDGLNEAYTDLVAKFSDTIEKTKGKNVHLKTAQTTYIACAIGFGVIQGLDIYKRTKQGDKEVLQKVRRWCPKVNVLVAERNKTSGLANIF